MVKYIIKGAFGQVVGGYKNMGFFFGYCKDLIELASTTICSAFDNDIYIKTGLELDDIDFYYSEAKKCGGRVMEIGCGYGRVLIPLLEKGIRIDGIDLSVKLVDVLKKHLEEEKLVSNIYVCDMRNFGKIKYKYQLVICPNYVMDYVTSYKDFTCILKNFSNIMEKKGRLIFNVDFEDEGEGSYGPAVSKIVSENGTIYTSIVETKARNGIRMCNLATFVTKKDKTQIYVSDVGEFIFDYLRVVEVIKISEFKLIKCYSNYQKVIFNPAEDKECIFELEKV